MTTQYEIYAYPKMVKKSAVRLLCYAGTLEEAKAKLPAFKEMLVADFRIQKSVYNDNGYRIFEETLATDI